MNIGQDIRGKNVLLVGGAGFIGHNLALALRNAGAEVTIADSFSINSILSLATEAVPRLDSEIYSSFLNERLELLRGAGVVLRVVDFCDRHSCSKTLADDEYDVVYLLAAVAHASRSNNDPVIAMSNQLLPLHNLIAELADRPSTRLVFLSSSTVYGNFKSETVSEKDECNPFGMYAVLKYMGEQLLGEFKAHSNLNFSIVRPSALYGERCISRRVSQVFLENAIAGRALVFSGNRDERLDFTYIQDLIQGLIRSGFHERARGEIFNITFGDAQPVLKLVDLLRTKFEHIDFTIKPRNQATPLRGTLSNEKAKNLIGFKPEWPLERGYLKYIDWYLSRDTSFVFEDTLASPENE